jgi:2-polyprenyl-6-hydroxyphenyl methylase/3-demethylubiquinone-9 3-methyltransferase
MTKPAKNTLRLWYDGGAEEAARFYAATFPDSSVGPSIARRATIRPARKGMS